MKASLDTNIIIHMYLAGIQEALFQRFSEELYIYEQIRKVELENHGQDIITEVDKDIRAGRICVITDESLKSMNALSLFQGYVKENRLLYGTGDLGEVYAISLAETLGICFLATDDIKQGGPYMSLLQFPDNEILPFTYTEILLLNYLEGLADAETTVQLFDAVNEKADLKWSFRSHIVKFVNRFWRDPYQEHEKVWMKEFCALHGVSAKEKLASLSLRV